MLMVHYLLLLLLLLLQHRVVFQIGWSEGIH
jgi:hypothetical protein